MNGEASMPDIKHVFVLMLENRSFDHMLGFSGLTGTDAHNGTPTSLNALRGGEANSFGGVSYAVGQPAPASMAVDPGHEFANVLEQLCGTLAKFPRGGPYPPINNSGFVSNFATLSGFVTSKSKPKPRPSDIMQCFASPQLPVLTALAKEFAICDCWFCSMPGPTWPNRLFAVAGSSAGLDHSPTRPEMGVWRTFRGFAFPNGSIFDRVSKWRIYSGKLFLTFALAIKGIHIRSSHVRRYNDFARDLNDPMFDAQFAWIEPNYGNVASDFTQGSSQHPRDGVARGELLIKTTYEAIRNSPVWETSLLIITWDEHGGFYDHMPPSSATPPDARAWPRSRNRSGFKFDLYGPRVPAVVISPFIPRNVIDHRTYDHASILATVERRSNLEPLTERDAQANNVLSLASLSAPRKDAPRYLPDAPQPDGADETVLDALDVELPEPTRGQEPADQEGDSLPGFLYLATRAHLQISPITQYPSVFARRSRVRTRQDARDYLEEVRRLVAATRRVEENGRGVSDGV
jgi:phospholipase C